MLWSCVPFWTSVHFCWDAGWFGTIGTPQLQHSAVAAPAVDCKEMKRQEGTSKGCSFLKDTLTDTASFWRWVIFQDANIIECVICIYATYACLHLCVNNTFHQPPSRYHGFSSCPLVQRCQVQWTAWLYTLEKKIKVNTKFEIHLDTGE